MYCIKGRWNGKWFSPHKLPVHASSAKEIFMPIRHQIHTYSHDPNLMPFGENINFKIENRKTIVYSYFNIY